MAPDHVVSQIESFISSRELREYLAAPKYGQIAGPAGSRLQGQAQTNPIVTKALQNFIQRRTEGQNNLTRLAGLCQRYQIVDLAPRAHTTALTADSWNVVLRVPKYEWYDTFVNESSLQDGKLVPSKFQNVSRVFYNKRINDFIKEHGYAGIRPLNQWLIHIPGRPAELSDENYLVVTEKIPELPETELNEGLFNSITEENLSTLVEFVETIYDSGTFNVNLDNTFIVNGRIIFLDTEKAGLGSGQDRFFYRIGEGEGMGDGKGGFMATRRGSLAGAARISPALARTVEFVKAHEFLGAGNVRRSINAEEAAARKQLEDDFKAGPKPQPTATTGAQ